MALQNLRLPFGISIAIYSPKYISSWDEDELKSWKESFQHFTLHVSLCILDGRKAKLFYRLVNIA
jgi:hypothetical protein